MMASFNGHIFRIADLLWPVHYVKRWYLFYAGMNKLVKKKTFETPTHPCDVTQMRQWVRPVVLRQSDWYAELGMHSSDVIMSAMASQVTGVSILFAKSFADQRKHQSGASLSLWGESTGGRWFPSQRASIAENISIWWRHHGTSPELYTRFPLRRGLRS